MHQYLKWVIYSAISIFTLMFGYFFVVSINNELGRFKSDRDINIESVKNDILCSQDSLADAIIGVVESNKEKMDSLENKVEKVERYSKKTDRKIQMKLDSLNAAR